MKMPRDVVLSTKTFIIAHLTILITGLLFFAGLYYMLYEDKFKPSDLQYIPVTREPVSLFLDISTPEDNILVYEDSLLLSGKTGPEYTVIISGNDTDTGLQAGKDGQFSKVLTLEEGANTILITAFDPDGNRKIATKSVFYTKEKL